MQLRIAWLELRHNKRFSILFVTNLLIGLVGFVALDGFKNSFETQLKKSSKDILTADISVTARREFTQLEEKNIRDIASNARKVSRVTSLFSMASSPTRTGLVDLKAIDDSHPLYGQIKLGSKTIHHLALHNLNKLPRVWVAPEVLLQFKVNIGDKIRLGSQEFIIEDEIVDDSGQSWGGAAYAPRIYMGLSFLDQTNLIKKGSTARRSINIKAAEGTDIKDLEQDLLNTLDTSVQVKSYFKAGQDNGRLLKYLTDYLGLVSLVALFLSGLGTFYLFRSYLSKKQKDIAILLSIGMEGSKATLIYLLQLVILGALSSLGAIFISIIILPQVTDLLAEFSPIQLEISLSYQTILAALALGILTPILLCLPLLLEIGHIKPAELFQEFYNPRIHISKRKFIGFLPAVVGIYILSVLQSHSFHVGTLFFVSIIVTAVLLILFAFFTINLGSLIAWRSVSTRLAYSYLRGHKVSSISCFLALALCSLLINLIPQIESTLLQEIERPKGEKLPSLFIFDIQEDQEQQFKGIIKDQGVTINFLSPMVRGRLTKINGQDFQRGDREKKFSREAEREQRFRNRGVNLSYRTGIGSAETIVSGEELSPSYNGGIGELSLEQNYAQRLGIQINDILAFEVQGLEIEGRVKNLRKVKWNSFQPNFFIRFQSGVIDDAPKTFLAALPPIDDQELKNRLQVKIVEKLPNISVIDVSKLVEKLGKIISQMGYVLSVMAILSVFAGLIVTFSIANHQIQQRIWDINLLKVLGGSFNLIRLTVVKEFFALSLAAGLVGSTTSLLASKLLAKQLFDGLWSPNLKSIAATLVIIVILCLATSLAASHQVLRKKPQLYL